MGWKKDAYDRAYASSKSQSAIRWIWAGSQVISGTVGYTVSRRNPLFAGYGLEATNQYAYVQGKASQSAIRWIWAGSEQALFFQAAFKRRNPLFAGYGLEAEGENAPFFLFAGRNPLFAGYGLEGTPLQDCTRSFLCRNPLFAGYGLKGPGYLFILKSRVAIRYSLDMGWKHYLASNEVKQMTVAIRYSLDMGWKPISTF